MSNPELNVDIPNGAGWPTQSVDSLCSLISRGTAPVYVEHSEVLAIGQRCVATTGFAPDFARPHSHRAMRNVLRPEFGDVLLNSTGTGTIGRSVVFNSSGTFIVDGHVTVMRPRAELVDSQWLNSLLRTPSFQRHLERFCFAGSTNQLELSRTPLRASRLPTPHIDEQRAMGLVIDTLDTAIHEAEAIIAKLKAVKHGLLRDLLTRGIDANGELRPPQTEAPHLYKWSPTGWIPNGWNSGPLDCWLDGKPKNGYSPKEAGEWTGIQMLGLGCLTLQGFQPLQLKPAPRGDKQLSNALLSDGDLLMSRANTRELVGMVGVYRDIGTSCTYPDLMMRLRPSSGTSAEFLQLVLQASATRRQVQAHAVGTSSSMVKISGKIVSGLLVAVPEKLEQNQILTIMAAGDARLNSEAEKVAVLRQLKAGLMDDLLTGRVRVTPLLAEAAQQKGSD
jgi:type I restriction enzyme S subunit